MRHCPVRVVGAGVSGLTAAIQLARHGASVEVFERRTDSGWARELRCDAVENWSSAPDLRATLESWSIDPAPFHPAPVLEVCTFDGECHRVTGDRPLLYAVKRGSGEGCLEWALKRRALDLGVTIRYGQSHPSDGADVWAVGARGRGFFLDVGITFRTAQPDRTAVLFDRRIAPRACAYLVILGGVGTLAVLLTREMGAARALLDKAIEAFRRIGPLDIQEPRIRSGFGGALGELKAGRTAPLVVGEAAGFLDYLWGFGVRHAMHSGALAARALLEGSGYHDLVAREIAPLVQSSLVNRRLFDLAGNRTYRALVRYFCARRQPHVLLQRSYRSRALRRRLASWAYRSLQEGSP